MTDKYDLGEALLRTRGFQVGREWIGFTFLFMLPFTLICTVVLTIVLRKVRIEPEKPHVKSKQTVAIGADKDVGVDVNLPFTPVDLTFESLVYEVEASTSDDKLRLLNKVDGVFKAGRMCALMGYVGDVVVVVPACRSLTCECKPGALGPGRPH